MQKDININNYSYTLPQERIALYPLEQRDHSKLLVYSNGTISHRHFYNLPEHLPGNSLLIFNNTKVIQARMIFRKETGAEIEIFLLNPVSSSGLILDAMQAVGHSQWKCAIGNLKRWKDDNTLQQKAGDTLLEASLVNREEGIVEFRWTSDLTFAEVIAAVGQTPLPPYLRRAPVDSDRERYQTVYSKSEGAVAAPTAGLHFTPSVFQQLKERNIEHDFVTLHVSAGTFQPVKENNAAKHVMHSEQIIVSKENIKHLLENGKMIIPVGTTSMRTLESIYWFGVKLLQDPEIPFHISQHDAYELPQHHSREDVLKRVYDHLEKTGSDTLVGETSIYIMPGYRFRICDALITNFHQPGSTLILLVAAFIGDDWKKVYNEALSNGYRFLSYGDSSLLLPKT